VPDVSPVHFESQPAYESGALYAITRQLAEAVMANMDRQAALLLDFSHPPGYWERQLAADIEARRVRHIPQRVAMRLKIRYVLWRYDWSQRLSVAWDSLRGRHDCGDDW
jgi:hypothetical protein